MPAITARGALRGVFVLQIALAVGVLARDFAVLAPNLAWPSLAPSLEAPVSPGDQTRRFAPVRRPFAPSAPGVQFGDMPSRLFIDESDPARVLFTGAIEEGDEARVADWLAGRGAATVPLPDRVDLHSPGGSVVTALEIGRMLRDAGLDTGVAAAHVCLSACPYILAGGVRRMVSDQAQVGVHQHYHGERTFLPAFLAVEDIQRGQAEVVVHLDEMGVDLRLMALAMATPPHDIYVLLPEESRDLGLATETLP